MRHSNENPSAKILVCGSINMDLVVRTPRLPTPGQTLIAHQLDEVSGGKGANQAVAVARLGGSVGMLAALGSDGFGATLRANLEQEGVDLEWIVTKPGPSGVAIVAVDDQSENSILVVPGANGELSPQDIQNAQAAIQNASLVMLQLEIPIQTVLHAVRLCRQHHVPVILNTAPVPEDFPSELFNVDLICPNQSETAALLKIPPPKNVDQAFAAARMLLEKGAKQVVITLGPLGAVAATKLPNGHPVIKAVEAHRVDAIDTVAAGDAFLGALAFQIAQGTALMEACLFASAAAAHAVTVRGAQPSLPYLDQVHTRL
ncbi:MAG: ribokinase [Planctomycetota bacterium]|nr:ribokinase [Planctomycetota bacterium]